MDNQHFTVVLEEMHSQFKVFGENLLSMKDDISEIKHEQKLMREQLSEHSFIIQVIRDDIRELKSDIAILKNDIDTLKKDVVSLRMDIKALTNRIVVLESRSLNTETQNTLILEEIFLIKREIRNLQNRSVSL